MPVVVKSGGWWGVSQRVREGSAWLLALVDMKVNTWLTLHLILIAFREKDLNERTRC